MDRGAWLVTVRVVVELDIAEAMCITHKEEIERRFLSLSCKSSVCRMQTDYSSITSNSNNRQPSFIFITCYAVFYKL